MKKSVRTMPFRLSATVSSVRRNRPTHPSANSADIYGTLPKTDSAQPVCAPSRLRISPVAQLEIIRLYMRGCSFCEITRRTGRARQTVTKICRSEDVQAKIRELKQRVLSVSDSWVASVKFAVDNETDGKLAYGLLRDFNVIPPRADSAQPKKPNEDQVTDRERLARANLLGTLALERGTDRQIEDVEQDGLSDAPSKQAP